MSSIIPDSEIPGSFQMLLEILKTKDSETKNQLMIIDEFSDFMNILNASLIASRIIPFSHRVHMPNTYPFDFLRKNNKTWIEFYFWHLDIYSEGRCTQETINDLTNLFSNEAFKNLEVKILLNKAAAEKWFFDKWEEFLGLDRKKLIEIINVLLSQNLSLIYVSQLKGKNIIDVPLYIESLKCADEILDGSTLDAVGKRYGLTREAVRQRIFHIGFSVRKNNATNKLIQVEKEKVVQTGIANNRISVVEFVRKHPGCLISEIVKFTNLSEDDVKLVLKDISWLVLDNESNFGKNINVTMEDSKLRSIKALKIAATLSFPLTGTEYDRLLSDGYFKGPTRIRIMQIFGSWTSACDVAGVESGDTLRKDYVRTWSEDELIGNLADYLVDPNYTGSINNYEEWRRNHPRSEEIPSFGTLKNQVNRSWIECRKRALMSLRSTWYRGD